MNIKLRSGNYLLETIVPLELYDENSKKYLKFPLQIKGEVDLSLKNSRGITINIINLDKPEGVYNG